MLRLRSVLRIGLRGVEDRLRSVEDRLRLRGVEDR